MAYQLTSLGISVLALLRERPMHGYEMFQTLVQRHADRIVKVRPGSLYHAVDRLTEEQLIRRGGGAWGGLRFARPAANKKKKPLRGGGRRPGTVSGRSVPSMKSPTPAPSRWL